MVEGRLRLRDSKWLPQLASGRHQATQKIVSLICQNHGATGTGWILFTWIPEWLLLNWCEWCLQGCSLGLDVSVSRRSQDIVSKRLGLAETWEGLGVDLVSDWKSNVSVSYHRVSFTSQYAFCFIANRTTSFWMQIINSASEDFLFRAIQMCSLLLSLLLLLFTDSRVYLFMAMQVHETVKRPVLFY